MRPDGTYAKLSATREGAKLTPFNSQDFFIALAEGRASAADIPDNHLPGNVFEPPRPAHAKPAALDPAPIRAHVVPAKPKRVRRPRTPKTAAS
jgi:hypothetical protein